MWPVEKKNGRETVAVIENKNTRNFYFEISLRSKIESCVYLDLLGGLKRETRAFNDIHRFHFQTLLLVLTFPSSSFYRKLPIATCYVHSVRLMVHFSLLFDEMRKQCLNLKFVTE